LACVWPGMPGRAVGQGSGHAGPSADPGLRVGACQVVLDSSLSDEQCLGDLAFRLPGRRELRDPQFAGSKRIARPRRASRRGLPRLSRVPGGPGRQARGRPAGRRDLVPHGGCRVLRRRYGRGAAWRRAGSLVPRGSACPDDGEDPDRRTFSSTWDATMPILVPGACAERIASERAAGALKLRFSQDRLGLFGSCPMIELSSPLLTPVAETYRGRK
jgi:hypothetical protein